jgi:hypothetical protein
MILTPTGILWGFLLPDCQAANLNAAFQCRYFAQFKSGESTGSRLAEAPMSGMLHSCRRPQIEFQPSALDERKKLMGPCKTKKSAAIARRAAVEGLQRCLSVSLRMEFKAQL